MNGVIQAVQEPEIILTSNTASLPFAQVDLRTRCAINCQGFMNHNEGSALFSILEGGTYEVTFNCNVTSAEAGDIALGLFSDRSFSTWHRNEYNNCRCRRLGKCWI